MKYFRRVVLIIIFFIILSSTSLSTISDGVFSVQTMTGGPVNPVPVGTDISHSQPLQTIAPAQTDPPAQTGTPMPPQSSPAQNESAGAAADETQQPTGNVPSPTPQAANEPEQTPVPPSETLSPTPEPEPAPDPTPTPEPTPEPTPAPLPRGIVSPYRSSYPSAYINGVLSDERQSWGFRRNSSFQPPEGFFKYDIRNFGGDYLGDISRPVVYLTFDEGYDMGFTPAILDTLKEKGVKAAFFVTTSFIRSSPELCARMKNEGHIVGNHSDTHRDMNELTDEEIIEELKEVERLFKQATGFDLDPFFRFPSGVYSMRALDTVYRQGYRTFFWSLAYRDWDVNNQPGKDEAFRQVTEHIHNGCVILLHSVSQSNAEALGDIIDRVHAMGFTFESLDSIR
ncbi:MAG: polysaccharide deacetylase family protein [Defluviitaleaceae bacterium]|nr:polysaccharide deacetylase family protein [Defluviitaleaceae bacterium]MCL2836136.1 polysaccharide deacetylase family protein [Defluviitaleaceae bacterium]